MCIEWFKTLHAWTICLKYIGDYKQKYHLYISDLELEKYTGCYLDGFILFIFGFKGQTNSVFKLFFEYVPEVI